MPVDLACVTVRIETLGLTIRGGFHPLPEDDVPLLPDGADVGTVLMVGNAGQGFWAKVRTAPEAAGPDPIDRWTRRVLTGIADATLFPFGGPPPHPFQRWARRADPALSVSPLGILIHPELGLWHALRGALLFNARLQLPVIEPAASPCDTCARKPCLSSCPVDAFSPAGYDVATCRTYLGTLSGQPCMIQGCQARLACPVGRQHAYGGSLAQHHMRAFARG